MSDAVKLMRQRHLSAEDAAATLIVSLVNALHHRGLMRETFEKSSDEFRILYLLYCYYYNLIYDRPERFGFAQSLVDDDVTRSMNEM